MRDNRGTIHAQQGHAAVLRVVQALDQFAQAGAHDGPGQLARQIASDLRLNQIDQRLRQALAQLEDHIAHEAVADDDIRASRRNIAALDVADKIQAQSRRALLQQLMCKLNLLVALALLLAVRQQADAWRTDVEELLHIDRAHNSELLEIFGFAVRIRAHIDDQADAIPGGEDAAQGGPLHARQAFEGKE